VAAINYKHLHYFWAVAKAGSITRAGERLHLTPQTISGQLTLFEEVLGHRLFDRVGRRLELTDAGRIALGYADEIFSLGQELQETLHNQQGSRTMVFRVGIIDAVPKSLAYQLVEPAVHLEETVRMVCREGKFMDLLADLAVQRLDIVISDRPMPSSVNVRGFNHLLGECGVGFFATPALAKQLKGKFPQCLQDAPFLLPGEDSAVRSRLMAWFSDQQIRPRLVGEFDDGALMKAFGEAGAGVFLSPVAIAATVCKKFNVVQIGVTNEISDQFYAISVERKLAHPAVVAISSSARFKLFAATGNNSRKRGAPATAPPARAGG